MSLSPAAQIVLELSESGLYSSSPFSSILSMS
jgi:hypothetical protein